MFGLFGSREKGAKILDKIWMSGDAKMNACRAMMAANPTCLFAVWFDDTVAVFTAALGNDANIVLAPSLSPDRINGKMLVFGEHHPLRRTEQELFSRLGIREVPVLSALDEPLFRHFGGDKTIALMRQLGMKEDEVLGHPLITKSIRNAQDKIASRVRTERPASSQKAWLELNGLG